MPQQEGSGDSNAPAPLFRFDPGWPFVIAGLALIVSAVLIPAQRELHDLEQRKIVHTAFEERTKAEILAYEQFLADMDRKDPRLLEPLVRAQLNMIPRDERPMLLMPTANDTVPTWIESSVTVEIPQPAPYPDTLLSRIASGPRRLWVLATGAFLVFMGVMFAPTTIRPRRSRTDGTGDRNGGGGSAPADTTRPDTATDTAIALATAVPIAAQLTAEVAPSDTSSDTSSDAALAVAELMPASKQVEVEAVPAELDPDSQVTDVVAAPIASDFTNEAIAVPDSDATEPILDPVADQLDSAADEFTPSVVELDLTEPPAPEQLNSEDSTLELSALEASAIEASAIEASALEASALEASASKEAVLADAILQDGAFETSAPESSESAPAPSEASVASDLHASEAEVTSEAPIDWTLAEADPAAGEPRCEACMTSPVVSQSADECSTDVAAELESAEAGFESEVEAEIESEVEIEVELDADAEVEPLATEPITEALSCEIETFSPDLTAAPGTAEHAAIETDASDADAAAELHYEFEGDTEESVADAGEIIARAETEALPGDAEMLIETASDSVAPIERASAGLPSNLFADIDESRWIDTRDSAARPRA